ncbi:MULTISPECIES: HK97 family phage prohead protease [Streptomyces]|uniref:HK97 family phage prohead protease n=1 Tax=Streptomyces TaxID=1883 RepID=UPI001EF259B3|nr:HK97 family phage prohead protease [Streptomyces rochei]
MPLSAAVRDLERSAPFQMQRAEGDEEGDGRSLSGYAALFGEPTEINSWEGHFTETIRKGAFRKTIREQQPVMQFDHGRHPLIGSIPIGSITTLREDDQGLYIEGRISDNWLMQPIRDAIAEQTVNGMSFRFEVVREEWRDADGKKLRPEEVPELLWMPGDRGPLQRELIEVRMRELGPVVFPAYAGTSVSVRARDVADVLVHDEDSARRLRAALARDAAQLAPQVPGDPELRREVAAAVLYQQPTTQTREAAPLPEEHPDSARTTGAPATDGHSPTSTTDAPPAPGHPSPPPRPSALRDQIREITALMGERLAHIDDAKEQS